IVVAGIAHAMEGSCRSVVELPESSRAQSAGDIEVAAHFRESLRDVPYLRLERLEKAADIKWAEAMLQCGSAFTEVEGNRQRGGGRHVALTAVLAEPLEQGI